MHELETNLPSSPPPLSTSANSILSKLKGFCNNQNLADLSGEQLLAERAQILGLSFQGNVSPGGSCKLLGTSDGIIAVNMPRYSDWELAPAWLETETIANQQWEQLSSIVKRKTSKCLVERAQIMGLTVAYADRCRLPPENPVHKVNDNQSRPKSNNKRAPLVIDLSSLWAGPLCSHLLWKMGANVIKVESTQRPDGARKGNAQFYGLLNQGKHTVAIDFHSDKGLETLKSIIAKGDIIIEASRPRALMQLGISAERSVLSSSAQVWISINGYGRVDPEAQWAAFGDDAAISAGMGLLMKEATGDFAFAGDALADPLTGMQAALSAWTSWRMGGRELISVSMRDVVSYYLSEELCQSPQNLITSCQKWADGIRPRVSHRPITSFVNTIGENSNSTLERLGIQC